MPRGAAALALLPIIVGGHAQAENCAAVAAIDRETAVCTSYVTQTGATGTSCHWTFPFRDEAALSFADTLWQSLQSCRPGAPRGNDQQVNHPDSYDLREWQTPSATYAIAVKDKGALNQTLVFLRHEPAS